MEPVIQKFEIEGFLGRYKLEMDFEDNVKIIVAENGFGKTTLLNMLYYTISGDRKELDKLKQYDFEYIKLSFGSGKEVQISREELEHDKVLVLQNAPVYLNRLRRIVSQDVFISIFEEVRQGNPSKEVKNFLQDRGIPLAGLKSYLDSLEKEDLESILNGSSLESKLRTIREEINGCVMSLPTEHTLTEILRGQFELDEDNENYQKILKLYSQLSQQFHEKIYNFNAWVFFQRMQNRKIGNKENKISLDQFDTKMNKNEIIKVSLDNVEVVGTSLRELQSLFPKQYETKEEDLEILSEDFRHQDPGKWYRGKQEFYFFCTFLGKVIEQLGKARKGKSDVFERDTEMKVIELNLESQGRIEQNIQLLSSYADIPIELYNYLDKMYNGFKEVV